MAHHCQAALITCEDFRLHQRADGRNYIAEFITNLKIDVDLITRGGAVSDLLSGEENNFNESLWRDLDISINLHQAQEIYLVNHTDCGAYAKFGFSSPKEEKDKHIADLRAARDLLAQKWPDKTVKMFLFILAEGSSDIFIAEQILS